MSTPHQIKAVTIEEMSQLIEKEVEIFTKMLLERVPENLADDYPLGFGKEGLLKLYKEVLKDLVSKTKLSLTSLMQLKFSQPTKYLWELSKLFMSALADVKRKFAKDHDMFDYNVEADITRTEKDITTMVEAEFKTELVLWKLMDDKKWEDAMIVVKTIEIERRSADISSKTEVANWKQIIAAYLADYDSFFVCADSILKMADESSTEVIKYNPHEASHIFRVIISKMIPKIRLSLSPMGYAMASKGGTQFVIQQDELFRDSVLRKLIEQTFTHRQIRNGEEFRNFISSSKKELVQRFLLLNPFVLSVEY